MKLFEKNVGKLDRMLRIVIGAYGIVFGYFFLSAPVSYLLVLVGAILTMTGILGTCGLYSVIGISTCGSSICDVKAPAPKATKSVSEGQVPSEQKPKRKKKAAAP